MLGTQVARAAGPVLTQVAVITELTATSGLSPVSPPGPKSTHMGSFTADGTCTTQVTRLRVGWISFYFNGS